MTVARERAVDAHINRIGTAVPPHDVHAAFVAFARTLLEGDKQRDVFDRMAERSGIDHRYSHFRPGPPGDVKVDAGGFYRRGAFPSTALRMAVYAEQAVELRGVVRHRHRRPEDATLPAHLHHLAGEVQRP